MDPTAPETLVVEDEVVEEVSSSASSGSDVDDGVSVASEELEESIEEHLALRPKGLRTEQVLAWWYAALQPVCRDISDELGGNECALISAEGLLLRFCCGREFEADFLTRPRFIEVVVQVEQFLARLYEVGISHYTLVFFDCLKATLLKSHPLLWVLRETLLLHCAANAATIPYCRFQSWYCPAYDDFITHQQPFIMVVEDGAHTSLAESEIYAALAQHDDKEEEDGDEDGEEEGGSSKGGSSKGGSSKGGSSKSGNRAPGEHGFSMLYLLMLNAVGRQISVCCLHNLHIVTRRVKAWSLSYNSYSAGLEAEVKEAAMNENILEELEEFIETKPTKCADVSATDFRRALYSMAAKDLLTTGEEEEDRWTVFWFKCLFLADLVAKATTLQDRRCELPPLPVDMYATGSEFFGLHLQHYLEEMVKPANGNQVQPIFSADSIAARECVDLYDELTVRRLVYMLVALWQKKTQPMTAEILGIDPAAAAELDALWTTLQSTSFFPITLQGLEDLVAEIPAHELFGQALTGEGGAGEEVVVAKPSVVNVTNDFLIQMMRKVVPGTYETDGEYLGKQLVKRFKESLGESGPPDLGSVESKEFTRFRTGVCPDRYDFASVMADAAATKGPKQLPKWLTRIPPERFERAFKRWELRCQQDDQVFARNINKYMGYLDKLHRPIVLIGGKCTSDHPWYKERKTADDEAVAVKPKKAEKKISNKAAAIISKNKEAKEEKIKKKDNDGYEQMIAHMDHAFRKKIENPASFQGALLELLVGNRNALDTTVLEDFPAVNKAIALPENRLEFLSRIAINLVEPLEHTWRIRNIQQKNQEQGILKLIGVIFRFVQVSTDKYLSIMGPDHIKVFQTLLMILGFANSAGVLFDSWARKQWELKNSKGESAMPAPVVEEKKKKKSAKPGAGQGSKGGSKATDSQVKSRADDERQRASYLKKLEQHRVKRCTKSFDFAIQPHIEMTFQMQYLGADMTRSLGSVADPRVPFIPDGWQKRLLDAVDTQESALVVAPTSSGKTFICYYAMDQALRFDNEACVVFVSPTRALALQVEAEVTARFSSKAYPAGSKTTLCGHLYEDRLRDWDNCQVLITVPSAFQAILSSKQQQHRDWQKKLKYVIIDEVHCIGDEKLGKDTENLVQLLPCPFMALSATVGNEDDFAGWLQRAQSFPNARPIKFIKYSERYADLKTLYYSSEQRALYNLNPILCVNYERAKSGTLTGDFAMVPPDCLQVFRAACEVLLSKKAQVSTAEKEDIDMFTEYWEPERYFKGTQAITKKQYGYYAKSVAFTLESYTRKELLDPESYQKILDLIGLEKPLGLNKLKPWYKVKGEQAAEEPQPGKTLAQVLEGGADVYSGFQSPAEFLLLIRSLESRRLLPALVFNFNRAFASRLFYRLVQKLVNDHHDKYYGTPELAAKTRALNKQRQDEYKAELSRREEVEKLKSLSKQQREEQGIDEQMLAELSGPPPPPPLDVADEHDSELFLCDRRMYLSYQEEFRDILNFCKIDHYVKLGRISPVLVEALRRGIGLYHDALHREYRRAVEYLFRARYLRVVVSDIALSMGVNMPCKSTVFAGDSSTLTPLLFRQTAGRAGRRGFDSLGQVVFWDFPFKKVRRVLCTKLPVLSGNFPVRPNSVLKAVKLSKVTDDEIVLNGLNAKLSEGQIVQEVDRNRTKFIKLLKASLFELGWPRANQEEEMEDVYGLTFRFAIDLLIRLGLLNNKGLALPMSVIVEALFSSDETSLLIPFALMSGALAPENVANSATANLLQFISMAVEKRSFGYNIVRRFELAYNPDLYQILFPFAERVSTLGSTGWSPLLPPMAGPQMSVLQEFDRLVLENGRARLQALTLAKQKRLAQFAGPDGLQECYTPLTETDFNGAVTAGALNSHGLAKKMLRETHTTAILQSPFFAGRSDDNLTTPEMICSRVRPDVYAEPSSMPLMLNTLAELRNPLTGEEASLPLVNSYLPELLEHRSLRLLIQHNKVGASEAYFVALAANQSLRHLKAALDSITEPTNADMADYSKELRGMVAEVSEGLAAVVSHIRA
ncbi:putative helicase [Gregarina niphandrodes]|uniref:Helicase n=1 Tax=Gregarina niphandrodes TaxID=110365 RepID=A0A023B7D3_GRENI|nr:putative helicase [Gregarina niphandrodes]EZG67215.1 putative helicase [Gregarina niphandrodes]|eukprot:XP_011130304.1 putative helicase [Gregarina niphandrodes]